jgi:hypothetical protein
LKWTFKKIPQRWKDATADLESLMSMDGAFKNYRAALHDAHPPLIPYIGVALQDLTFGKLFTNVEIIGDDMKLWHSNDPQRKSDLQ